MRADGGLTSGVTFMCLKAMEMSLLSASVKPILFLVALVGEAVLVEADMMARFDISEMLIVCRNMS